MTNITAADVNKLRKMTGAGMMDCKNALVESNGDYEAAVEILRKKGQKVAMKRADREATEGIILARTNDAGTFGAVVTVNSETDFVGKSEDFVNFANAVIDVAVKKMPGTLDELKQTDLNGRTVEENLTDLVGKTGEKLELAGYDIIDAPLVSAYNHQGSKLATLVGMNSNSVTNGKQIAFEVAMQVAAMNPVAVDKDDVDQKIIEKEIEIGKEQARAEGKPDNMLEKIALGKLNKFYKDNTLLNQEFIRDNSKSIRQYLQEADKDFTVVAFRRQKLGD